MNANFEAAAGADSGPAINADLCDWSDGSLGGVRAAE